MYYVYIIRSIHYPEKIYIGFTEDIEARIHHHNTGASPHTAKFRPWKFELYIAFSCRDKALAFERYLKSGSGRAFSRKHLL